ncbi:hypothetical protein GUITHDRAFT_135488 [Guillardia theta CCMP2712]|uniref:mitogen-activated protein kinase kinase n=1 Tax=Guillardia theta (strain CCMP2712) TaxID=905079 RepID=L1JP44_GUITC|nr:hypothetical protein GUITHDRAFT_135488 [Guillardia theta CCMP2712]EKX50346.1 hypothetical protein GUITHDRAFT_135488 [Guillardia theta CCMP2712]|eukprot:XP_005837326.1 hypothetical protein GUITHDRAFT_135488 [Guillardia theta CCMP2712]
MFTCGSVCIDRNGLHKKLLDADIAAAPQTLRSFRDSYADKGLENRSSRQRMSRADLEAKRGAAEGGRTSYGGWVPLGGAKPLRVKLEDLVKIKGMSSCLGKGVSGTVWKVMDQSVQEILALKEMALEADEEKCKLIVQEMQIMLDLDHPSIVACHGVFYDMGIFKIVMEFMDEGSLLDILRFGDHKVSVPVLGGLAKQILEAMRYLHVEKRVIHRDVKVDDPHGGNLKGECKLADFGVCRGFERPINSKPRDRYDSTCATWVGTVTYMSPERILGNSYSFNADVWALGVIMVEAALGRYPYLVEGMDKKKFEFWDLMDVMINSQCATSKLPHDIDPAFKSFCQYILEKDHELRPSSVDALTHPFLQTIHEDVNIHIAQWISEDRRSMDAKKISRSLGGLSIGEQNGSAR